MEIFEKISKICECKQNVDLKTMCYVHIGGVGSLVCYPKTIKQVKRLIRFLYKNKIKYFVVGNGTNVVFDDEGYYNVLICFKKMCGHKLIKNGIVASCGLNLFALNHILKTESLGGLEWSFGIPGTVGGAIFMNAGAYGHEIYEFVKCVWAITPKGKIKKIDVKDMGFGYRTSNIKQNGNIVLKASFKLSFCPVNQIEKLQQQYFAYRKCCQPYGTYNCGSVFKKTPEGSAGKIIDKLGLKSVKIGDIQISPKHANFFVNLGQGTSKDLKRLVSYTKIKVKQKTGICLEEEIIFVNKN